MAATTYTYTLYAVDFHENSSALRVCLRIPTKKIIHSEAQRDQKWRRCGRLRVMV
jgi:hypothetical protein